ncbi:MAG: hypothetical protein IKD94_03240 [Erysipelotrichaceae bacterium]|nr:hypothetical protein [Erysipelotrichaceae bacterium]
MQVTVEEAKKILEQIEGQLADLLERRNECHSDSSGLSDQTQEQDETNCCFDSMQKEISEVEEKFVKVFRATQDYSSTRMSELKSEREKLSSDLKRLRSERISLSEAIDLADRKKKPSYEDKKRLHELDDEISRIQELLMELTKTICFTTVEIDI